MAASFIAASQAKHSGGLIGPSVVHPLHLSRKWKSTPPSAVDRLTTAVPGATNLTAAAGLTVNVRLPQSDYVGELLLAFSLAAPAAGAYAPNVGINMVRSLTIRVGSHTLYETQNLRAALKTAFMLGSEGRRGKLDNLLSAAGPTTPATGAIDVCIPIPWAFSSLLNGGPNSAWLPTHLAKSGSREIAIDITFNAGSTFGNDGTYTSAANPITAASLIAHTLVFLEGEKQEAEAHGVFLHHFVELQSQPAETHAPPATPTIDLSGFSGTMTSAFFYHTSEAGGFADDPSVYGDDGLAFASQMRLDGRTLELSSSASERRLEGTLHDLAIVGDATAAAGEAIVVPIALSPAETHHFSGGVPLRDVRNISVDLDLTSAVQTEVCVASSAVIVLESGSFRLLR